MRAGGGVRRKTYEKREEHTEEKIQSYLDTVQNNIQSESLTLEVSGGNTRH